MEELMEDGLYRKLSVLNQEKDSGQKKEHEHSSNAGEHGACSDRMSHSVWLEHGYMQGTYRR